VIWRGEVYWIDLGQPVGHDPAFRRPGVIVSTDVVNNGAGDLVVVVPVTSTKYGLRSHVEVVAEVNPPGRSTFARCDQVRAIASQRVEERIGNLSHEELQAIDDALRFILEL
jgi:mRNA interferase MazF